MNYVIIIKDTYANNNKIIFNLFNKFNKLITYMNHLHPNNSGKVIKLWVNQRQKQTTQ